MESYILPKMRLTLARELEDLEGRDSLILCYAIDIGGQTADRVQSFDLYPKYANKANRRCVENMYTVILLSLLGRWSVMSGRAS